MVAVPDRCLPVMYVLTRAPVAWMRPEEVALALGEGADETSDLLCDLDLEGWIEVWEDEQGPLICLTPLAAERLRLRLVENGPGVSPRWVSIDEPEPPLPRVYQPGSGDKETALGFVQDNALPPDVGAERAEITLARARELSDDERRRSNLDGLPRPTLLLGVGTTPWPGPTLPDGWVCPVCGNRALAAHMYCLYCDRWGFDHRFNLEVPPIRNAVPTRRRRRSEPDPRERDRLESDRLRLERRTKHAAKLQEKIDSERERRQRQRTTPRGPSQTTPRPHTNAENPRLGSTSHVAFSQPPRR